VTALTFILIIVQVEILQKNVDEKDAKIESLSSLLDESAMNEHLKHLTDQVSSITLWPSFFLLVVLHLNHMERGQDG
jgi:hypothetical protein